MWGGRWPHSPGWALLSCGSPSILLRCRSLARRSAKACSGILPSARGVRRRPFVAPSPAPTKLLQAWSNVSGAHLLAAHATGGDSNARGSQEPRPPPGLVEDQAATGLGLVRWCEDMKVKVSHGEERDGLGGLVHASVGVGN